jgi:two-component system chemotaxis response regulator CheB
MLAGPATSHRAVSDENALPPIRVMIVDDSAVARGLISRWVEAEPGLEGARP